MKKLLIIVAVILAVAGFGIYKLFGTIMRAADRGDAVVATFHKDYNANDIKALHSSTTPAFQQAVPLDKFTLFINNLREKLGDWQSGERTGVNVENKNGNQMLYMTCSAKFAKGEGTEDFAFDYNGDQPVLIRYNVQSPALIEKSMAAGAEAKEAEAKTAAP